MKAIYRGVEIESKRERALGGWSEVYWSAYRVSDGFEVVCDFGGGTVREMFAVLKTRVDEFLDKFGGDDEKFEADRWEEVLGEGGLPDA